jgi:hypothetical protein
MLTFYSNNDLTKMYYSDGKTMLTLSPVISREEYIKAALEVKNTGTNEYEEVGILNTLVRRKYTNIIPFESGVLFTFDNKHELFQTSPGCNGILCSEPFQDIDVYDIPSALDGKNVSRSVYSKTHCEWCNERNLIHRENDLPAIIKGKHMEWRINGVSHRENNMPATIYKDGTKEYYLNGTKYNPTDVPTADASNNANTNMVSTDEPVDTPTDAPTDEPVDTPTDAPTDAPVDTPTDAPTDEPDNKDIIAAKNRGCRAVIKLLSTMMNLFHKGELDCIRDILVELGITLEHVFEFIIADKDKLADEDTRYRHIAKEIFKARLRDYGRLATNLDVAVSGLGTEVVLEMYEPFLLTKKLSEEPVPGRLLYEYLYILSNYPWGDYDFNPFLLRFMKEARDETKIMATQLLLTHAK